MAMIQENMQDITASHVQPEAEKRKGNGARKYGQAIIENARDLTATAIKPGQHTGEHKAKRDHANTQRQNNKSLGG